MRRMTLSMFFAVAALAGCGGGGPSANPAPTYAVGGTVTGLSGSGLTLKNGADTLNVTGNGSFVLPTRLASGASYSVTIGTQPSGPAQLCTVGNGAGTVGTGDVITVAISCTTSPSTYAYAAVPHSAADANIGRIEYFAFDAATGRLSLRGAVAMAAQTSVFYVKAAPSGRQLLVSTTTFAGSGRVTSILSEDLALYDLAPATGAPSGSTLLASPGGGDLIVHPNRFDLYAPGPVLRHYSLAPGAAQGQSLTIGQQSGFASAIAPDGRYLFMPDVGSGLAPDSFIAVVSLADPVQPRLLRKVPIPIAPQTVTISPDGKLLYVAPSRRDDPGHVYRVDDAGGLTPLGTFASPTYVRSAVITPSGAFLYLASSDDNTIQGYRLDGTGGVTPLGSGTAVPSAFRAVLGPEGKYLYALSVPVDGRPGAIYGFAIGADGSLTPVPGSPVETGEREYDISFATPNP